LDTTISRSFSNTEDRLDALLGKQGDILARQFNQEQAEAVKLLEEAKRTGDNDIVVRAQANIAKLKQAQAIELAQFRDEERKAIEEKNQAEREKYLALPSTVAAATPTVSKVINVRLNFGGQTGAITVPVLGQNGADDLIAALEKLAANNLIGVN
jgi:hypothetical protein